MAGRTDLGFGILCFERGLLGSQMAGQKDLGLGLLCFEGGLLNL